MYRVTNRHSFIEPQLPSLVEQPPEGKHWIHEIKHDGYRSQLVIERDQVRVFNGMDTIGVTVIPLSSAPLPSSPVNRQSLMVRPLSRMATVLLTSVHFNPPCGGSLTASLCMRLICCISTAKTSVKKVS
jgi:hypothetical protein